jgi:dienelactone hydrolase
MASKKIPPAGTYAIDAAPAKELLLNGGFFSWKQCSAHDCQIRRESASTLSFRFPSAYPAPEESNRTVLGKIWPVPAIAWQAQPTVVLVHGWNDELGYRYRFPWLARKLNRAGWNALALQLPFHMDRRPRQKGQVRDFLSENLHASMRAAQQSLVDLSSILLWLKSMGAPKVGLWGSSLGGWLTGVFVSQNDQADFAVLTSPVVDMAEIIGRVKFCRTIHRSLCESGVQLEKLSLERLTPHPLRNGILLHEAVYDQFVPASTVESLEKTWGVPNWRFKEGHISILMNRDLIHRTIQWITTGREKTPQSDQNFEAIGRGA